MIMGPRILFHWRLVATLHAHPPPMAGPRGRLRGGDAPGPADLARTRSGRPSTRPSRRRDGPDHIWSRRPRSVLVVQWKGRRDLPRMLRPVGRLPCNRRRMAVGRGSSVRRWREIARVRRDLRRVVAERNAKRLGEPRPRRAGLLPPRCDRVPMSGDLGRMPIRRPPRVLLDPLIRRDAMGFIHHGKSVRRSPVV